MSTLLSQYSSLLAFLLACAAMTILPRVLPLYCLGNELPGWLKDWLEYIPCAVMAALVVPDMFFYNNAFDANPLTNIFLSTGILSIVFCAITKNFFATILFAMAMVATFRYFGWS